MDAFQELDFLDFSDCYTEDERMVRDTVRGWVSERFLPLVMEHYDLIVPRARLDRVPVQRLLALLTSQPNREALRRLGFEPATSVSEESV